MEFEVNQSAFDKSYISDINGPAAKLGRGSEKPFVSNQDESIRLFKKDFLEILTKVHPATPIVIFLPVIIYCVVRSAKLGSVGAVALNFGAGLLFWTFFEYVMHRFLFHYHPKGKYTERLHYLFHGIHHDYPRDSRRLVMPPSVSIPLATLIYYGMGTFMGGATLPSFYAGFILGYLCYDMIHFAIHHFNFKNRLWQHVKMHHLRHHYSDSKRKFGVSSPLWDIILKTN